MLVALGLSPAIAAEQPRVDGDDARLMIVRDYADRVLEVGRDRWSGEDTPLFTDGVHVDTLGPVEWRHGGERYVISNLASQQNLFRVLVGLSKLLDEPVYCDAAEAAIAYHFDHLADSSGLLRWGGHQFIDLKTLDPVGDFDADCHEFKHHYPFYELMYAVDPAATTIFLRALWQAHVFDWRRLDLSRHGRYGGDPPDAAVWDQPFADPDPFFEGEGLSFVNAGGDLIYAAGHLRALADERSAWVWGRRMAHMYRKARHPETQLGAYQFSKPERRQQPPNEGPLEGRLTWSSYGDRAENQFGEQFGEVAREGWVLWGGRVRTIYATTGFMQLGLAESMGDDGESLATWTADGLEALAEYAYMPEANAFRPMWADGTDLTGKRFARSGYYGEKGTAWEPLDADMRFLMAYARAYRLTSRPALWTTARAIAHGLGLGDIGERPGVGVALDVDHPGDDPVEIFALLELHRAVPDVRYLLRARLVADRLIEKRYHRGFFLPDERHVHARFDAIEPLALLALEAALRGEPGRVPAHVGGEGYIHGRFDGHGRTYDHRVIWNATREQDRP